MGYCEVAWVAERKESIFMATLTKDKRTGAFVIQWNDHGRKSITLSGRKYRQSTAEQVKALVETLIYCRNNGIVVPDKTTAKRLDIIAGEIREKLAKHGLIQVIGSKTCRQLWDACLKCKTDVKPNTVIHHRQTMRVFFETFSPTQTIESITSECLLEWKTSMLTRYAPASVAGFIKTAKMVFTWAVENDWLPKSPMKHIPQGSFRNRRNDRTISMAEYAELLDACPNQEWRTIIALARIGGIRCPSELRNLRWTDVNWAKNRVLIRSPKTEHHEGHHERIIPLFPELRAELDRLFFSLDDTDENEFVVKQYRRVSLTNQFQKIAVLAGLGTIKCPFRNMRRNRSNEVRRQFGELKERLWIGHSEQVMEKHYAVLSDDEYSEAAEVDLQGQIQHAESHANLTGQDRLIRVK